MAASIARSCAWYSRTHYLITFRLLSSKTDEGASGDSLPGTNNKPRDAKEDGMDGKDSFKPNTDTTVHTSTSYSSSSNISGANDTEKLLLSIKPRIPRFNEYQQKGGMESALEKLGGVVEKAKQLTAQQQDSNNRNTGLPEEIDFIKDDDKFPTILRKSKLINIGRQHNRVLVGKIFRVIEDDLYIEFGGKFHCVCTRPKVNQEKYHQGVQVKLQLKDSEMTSKFLGSEKHVTILEGNATLLGLYEPERNY